MSTLAPPLGLALAAVLLASMPAAGGSSMPPNPPNIPPPPPPPGAIGPVRTELGVSVSCPPEANAAGPIPIEVAYLADSATNRASGSVPLLALRVVLIRRDAPGLAALATMPLNWIPPSEMVMPPSPGNVADTVAGSITVSPLDNGRKHDGAAEYSVIAAFARWTDGPVPLRVKDPDHRLAPGDAIPAPPPRDPATLPEPPKKRGLVAAAKKHGTRTSIEGAFRAAIPSPIAKDEAPPPAFVTIFAARLDPKGGASGRSFVVMAGVQGQDYVGRFSIPLSLLASPPEPGKYRVFVFAGSESTPPFEVDLP